MGDHTETIEIDFDPKVTSYRELLDAFWSSHHCGYQNGSTQYMNAVFFRNEEQKRLAEESVAAAAKKSGLKVEDVTTKIVPATRFTYAEDYHQKYRLRRYSEIVDELTRIYPDFVDLANSTVATRLNAYLAGAGDRSVLEAEIEDYGLSEAAQKSVLSIALRR